MTAHADGDELVLRVAARGARLSAAALHAFDGSAGVAPSAALELVAARAIITTQGGRATLHSNAEDALIEARVARQTGA